MPEPIANAPSWLAALCEQVEDARDAYQDDTDLTNRLGNEVDDWMARAENAEAAVERVRRLATMALYKGPEPAGTHAVVLDSLAKELLAALDAE